MMTEHMYDVGVEFLEDGNARIEQSAGSLEGATYIDLHPVQVRLLAERMGLLNTQPLPLGLPVAFEGNGNFHHLEIERDEDGTVHLFQTQIQGMGGSDEHVMLHLLQAAWLASQLPGKVSASATIPKGTLRRIRALHDRIERFCDDTVFRSEIVERCGYGFQILDAIDHIRDWSQEVVDDLADLEATEHVTPETLQRNATVATNATQRNVAADGPMTATERSRQHRARKAAEQAALALIPQP